MHRRRTEDMHTAVAVRRGERGEPSAATHTHTGMKADKRAMLKHEC